jgi:hypothetical protein
MVFTTLWREGRAATATVLADSLLDSMVDCIVTVNGLCVWDEWDEACESGMNELD